jgi:hypothetical protein
MALLSFLREKPKAPERTYFFSDTYGGPIDPTQRSDADALICTDFRSRPLQKLHRDFDTFGKERVTDHVLKLIVELHDKISRCSYFSRKEKREFRSMGTGVLVNAAPRIDHTNGVEFHLATLRNNIRVIATGLASLSAVRSEVETVQRIPNADNNLWPNGEQFRSSYAGLLLDPRFASRFPLVDEDPSAIPEPKDEWIVGYVDRFGNIVTDCRDPQMKMFNLQRALLEDRSASLKIGDVPVENFSLGNNLGSADPGSIVIYGNGNVDIVRKWGPRDTAEEKIAKSAYHQFGRPQIGTPVSFVTGT